MKDRQVSHYLLLDKLGEGGMGVVYKAKDSKLGRTVAIKFLPPELTRNEKAKQRFIQEAQAASMIDHQNICTIYEVDETEDGQMFLCMAHYQGMSLKDKIGQEGPLDQRLSVEIAIQIADGLKKAHSHGIIHRDIKPANIFITDEGKVKILDFGLAKLAGQLKLTTTGKAMGTVSYMSPEQGRGEEVGEETDVWALGTVLYEMVTGQLPFTGEYDVAVMYSILHEEPETVTSIRSGVSPELELIIHKCLAKDKEERYTSIDEMISDLKRFHRQFESDEVSSAYSWGRYGGRSRLVLPVATLAILAAAVIVAVIKWPEQDGDNVRFAKLPGIPRKITSGDSWDSEPALSPAGGTIAFTSDAPGNKDIFVADVTGGNTLQLTRDKADDYYPVWFPDGNSIAFVSERGGTASIWKTSQLGGGSTLLLSNAVDPAVSRDGRWIAFSTHGEGGDLRIAVAPLSDLGDVTILTDSDDGIWSHRRPAWSPDGSTLCYHAQHDLWLVPSSGGEAERLTKDGEADFDPVWSSMGDYIYFSSWRDGTLAIWGITVPDGQPERLTMGTGLEHNPSVCESGVCMAYSTQISHNSAIVRNLETGEEFRVEGPPDEFMAAVSPEGDRIAYISDRGGPDNDLWLQELRAGAPYGAPRRLTDTRGDVSHPVFSKDGEWITYYGKMNERRDIFIIRSAGGNPVRITDHEASDIHPAWSPDGTRLAFVSKRSGGSRIWIVEISGGKTVSGPERLEGVDTGAYSPVWSGDGKHIAYIGYVKGTADVWIVPVDGSYPARKLTSDAGIMRVRWDHSTGTILASGTWGTEIYDLRRIPVDTSMPVPFEPPVIFGSKSAVAFFDLSVDGRTLIYSREDIKGNIWILEGKEGDF